MKITLTHPNLPTQKITIKQGFSWPCLFFGPLWFVAKGFIGMAVLSCIIAIPTLGISWLVLPFMANRMLLEKYLQLGYTQ